MYRPKNKAERLQLREYYLTGYTAEEAAADCVIATAEENGRYLLRIFDGSAAYPCVNCSFRTMEQRQREIDYHIETRRKNIKAKEARKQAKNAAGAYVVDKSKPHFEAGREYYMEYYNDDPWPHTATIRIIKRSACFVTLAHVYGSREDEPRRVKVSVDERGEYLSYGSFYYFRASSCVEQTTEDDFSDIDPATVRAALAERGIVNGQLVDPEKLDANPFIQQVIKDVEEMDTAEQEKQQQEREYVLAMRNAGRVYIEEVAAAHPIQKDAPVVTIQWSECPAFYSWAEGELKLSVAAAEIIVAHYDKAPDDGFCYYKTKFTVTWTEDGTGKSHTDRYDLGDLEGGLINHIRRYNSALADLLEEYTAAGLVVSVSVAPWLEEAVKARQKAVQERAQNVLDMVDMLTDEQLAAAVFTAPKDTPDIARFFLQALARRDEKKALSVFKSWKDGAGLEALDEI